jgi:AbrB family looped-hinge helix DNA binding protein
VALVGRGWLALVSIAMESVLNALLTLFSRGQLVIPDRLRQLLRLNPGNRLELSLEADGLLLKPRCSASSASARERISCAGYQGPPVPLDQQDPALDATKALP